jgi:protein-S-isoprenylcysteine O-methyltransferase Ste14
VLLFATVVQTAISIYYVRQTGAAAALFKHRQAGVLLTGAIVLSYVAYTLIVLAFLIQPNWAVWSSVPLPVWMRWLGVIVLLMGAVVVVRGFRDLGRNLTISPSTKEDHKLVTTGSYGWVRHPLYSGVFVQSVGVCLLMANWFAAVSSATFCVLIALRTRLEEANLVVEFGDDYRQYQQRVGMFVPNKEKCQSVLQTTLGMVAVSLLSYVMIAGILFGVAGRWDLPWFWLTVATFAGSHLVSIAIVIRDDPDLARERMKPGAGVPSWDKTVLRLIGILAFANLAVGSLDVGRWRLSDSVPQLLQACGLVGIAAGMAMITWCMVVNSFFAKVVRIQEDRGHHVIDSGPYQYIRHPGYFGWVVLWFSFNLALGSWLAVGGSFLANAVMVVRTSLEDGFLTKNLAGYDEYSQRVRSRLLPGIW